MAGCKLAALRNSSSISLQLGLRTRHNGGGDAVAEDGASTAGRQICSAMDLRFIGGLKRKFESRQ